jgi:hypothetical protein
MSIKRINVIFILNAQIDELSRKKFITPRLKLNLKKLGIKNLQEIREKIVENKYSETEKIKDVLAAQSRLELCTLFSKIGIDLPKHFCY